VLFRRADLDGIAAGRITLAFRRWDRPRVKPGGRQRTPIGVIAFDAVKRVGRVSNADARRAGYASAEALHAAFAGRDGDLYRVELRLAGPDPRVALREREPTPEELAAIRARLARMGDWTYQYLRTIAERPGVRAEDLAASFGREKHPFKLDIRKLKELGLTESLPIGYRLSPRGAAVIGQTPLSTRVRPCTEREPNR
jgi:hypothetical protein